jgi:NAD(P)-dependent dehydrogenase (short-subunit alcohol dehydrogenase family)
MIMDLNLQGRRVLVTGGNSGLGAAMAEAFAEAGARVAINYVVQPEEALRLAGSLRDRGFEILTLRADVTQRSEVDAMFQRIEGEWGGIDVLLNNAGIDGPRALTWEADPDEWWRVMQVNLWGAFLCAREALKRMVSQKSGVILNTSSVHERIAWSGYSAYTASKAGLSMLSKTMAQEAACHGVRVLCIAPGAIRTAINAEVWSSAAGKSDLLSKIPLGRVGDVEDVAGLALVLASDRASYMTGTTVFVDGGMMDYPEFRHGG